MGGTNDRYGVGGVRGEEAIIKEHIWGLVGLFGVFFLFLSINYISLLLEYS